MLDIYTWCTVLTLTRAVYMHYLSALVTKCCSVVTDSPIPHWGSRGSNFYPYMVKGKEILVTCLDRARVLQEAEASRFHDNRHMRVLTL